MPALLEVVVVIVAGTRFADELVVANADLRRSEARRAVALVMARGQRYLTAVPRDKRTAATKTLASGLHRARRSNASG